MWYGPPIWIDMFFLIVLWATDHLFVCQVCMIPFLFLLILICYFPFIHGNWFCVVDLSAQMGRLCSIDALVSRVQKYLTPPKVEELSSLVCDLKANNLLFTGWKLFILSIPLKIWTRKLNLRVNCFWHLDAGWKACKKWFRKTVSISYWGPIEAICYSGVAWLEARFFLDFV